ncbi:hypothetical protein CCR97_05420 [Rhodoplanes elegans]|uniref:Uncharacterized protein n=1 Tax=Rhodoplanes elegans TaxID=29408 RepID=A0A327KQU3_9BRAD|nr:hypothetical protein [Rhodoplanes elegans]MBK5957649.1 hypothetical protein [Rhodoplanes elegans]RAI41259.1 hypothetical protein CH338_03610 [Rhodoplanes elegans]
MMRLAVLVAISVVAGSTAEAETFSIRCTHSKFTAPRFSPYHATFDLDAKLILFEPATGQARPATIRSSDDQKVLFSVHGDGGDLELTWDRSENVLVWPGFIGDELRPALRHVCEITETRTMVSGRDDVPGRAEDGMPPFSLRCHGDQGPFFFTFDPRTRKALMEGYHYGGAYAGTIREADAENVAFSLDTLGLSGSWRRRDRTLTMTGYSDDPARRATAECNEIGVRSIMHVLCAGPGRVRAELCK